MSVADSDPLAVLSAAGVSVWLDDLSRELLAGGELKKLVTNQHVVGVTTNPTIFASALSKGDRYSDQLRGLAREGSSVDDAVFALTTDDVRDGCDVLLFLTKPLDVAMGDQADGESEECFVDVVAAF
ncbi:transaldolase family protein, partial [Streptomyces sp. NPDC004528]|uniref:transaldolase family protein n=1 Tax=Streptomyces sp. NPDC004528 TaxID=3154550 RepID=UPI0033BA3410